VDAIVKPVNSGGFVLEKYCKDRHALLLKVIGFGLAILGLVLTFTLGYILNGESVRNSKVDNQDGKITDIRIEAAAVKSDLTTIKEDLRDIKRILSGMKAEDK